MRRFAVQAPMLAVGMLAVVVPARGGRAQPAEPPAEAGTTAAAAEADASGPAAEPLAATDPAPEAAPEARPHLDAARSGIAQTRGRTIYRQRCASCHGIRGDGRGLAARFLDVAPRNFTTGVYKWRATATGELPSDADLLRTIRRGVPGTSMPGWDGRLPLRDQWAVVQYLKTLSPRFSEEAPAPPLVMPDRAPTLDDEARRRGRLVYVMLQCWRCHGMTGRGDGPAASTLLDDDGLPILAYDFTQGQMRGGTRPLDIYRTFTTGVNGTPMPSYEDAILVGQDGYTEFDTYAQVLSAEGLQRLRAFLGALPTTEQLWALPEDQRRAWGARMRWDLVAYVLSLSSDDTTWRYLWAPRYRTE